MKAEEAVTLTFDQLVTHFRPFIGHIRQAYYVPRMSFEDVEQEVLIVMWRCYQRVQDGARLNHSFDSYMRQAVVNRLIDLSRHAGRQPIESPLEDASILASDNSKRAFDDAETQVQLDSASLSEDAKLLVCYVMGDQRDYRAAFIRQVRGTRYGAVQRYNAARLELAKVLVHLV